MDEPHTIEGYATCQCGSWVLREIASRTGGMCSDCFLVTPHFRHIEIVGRGMRTQVSLRQHKPNNRPMTEARIAKKKVVALAKTRARKRLAAIFSDAYDILLAEERGALGLNPWPTEQAIRSKGTGEADAAFAALALELNKIGVDTR